MCPLSVELDIRSSIVMGNHPRQHPPDTHDEKHGVVIDLDKSWKCLCEASRECETDSRSLQLAADKLHQTAPSGERAKRAAD